MDVTCHELRSTLTFDPKRYGLDEDYGFMFVNPLETLPSYFGQWNDLASNVVNMLKERTLRDAVNKLPLLDHNLLVDERELFLAHLQLSIIASGYVWQDGDQRVAKVLPKSVAVPLCAISNKLDIQPILSHTSVVLANCVVIDTSRPFDLDNLKCLYHLPGFPESDWFLLITARVEFIFARCIKPTISILERLQKVGDHRSNKKIVHGDLDLDLDAAAEEIAENLDKINDVIREIKEACAAFHGKLTAHVFFNQLRPFLAGWGGEGNPLPDGLLYEGVSSKPFKLTGGSGAQSTSFQVMDALLGVEHTKEAREFILDTRRYMQPRHRLFIKDLEEWPFKLSDFVSESASMALKKSFNKCVTTIVDLRSYHMGLVTKYVVQPSKAPSDGKYRSLNNVGTGGTSLIPFLKGIKQSTQKKSSVANKRTQPQSPQMPTLFSRVASLVMPRSSSMLMIAAVATAVSMIVFAVMWSE